MENNEEMQQFKEFLEEEAGFPISQELFERVLYAKVTESAMVKAFSLIHDENIREIVMDTVAEFVFAMLAGADQEATERIEEQEQKFFDRDFSHIVASLGETN